MNRFRSKRDAPHTAHGSQGVIPGRSIGAWVRPVAAAVVAFCVGHWAWAAAPDRPIDGGTGVASPRDGGALACALAMAPHRGNADIDRQIRRLQAAVRAGPGSRSGDRSQAQQHAQAAALEQLGWAFVSKARESLDPGYYVTAGWCARCVAETVRDSAEALLLEGHIHHSLHRFRRAEEVASRLVARRGSWFDHGLLGDALMEVGRLDEAALHYQHMMDVRPGPQSYSRAAHLRWLRGDLAGTLELMEMAVRSVSPRSRESAAWMRARLARYQLQNGQIDAAQRTAQRALAIFPGYPPALLGLGIVQLARSDFETAVTSLRPAADANPLPDYQWALIDALEGTGQLAEADEVRRELLSSGAANDGRTTALYLATARTDVEEALRLARAELRQRQDVHSHDALAWALAANGEYAAAEDAARLALAEGTADPRILLHAGIIAEKRGNIAEATALLARAASSLHALLPSEQKRLDGLRAQLERHSAG